MNTLNRDEQENEWSEVETVPTPGHRRQGGDVNKQKMIKKYMKI